MSGGGQGGMNPGYGGQFGGGGYGGGGFSGTNTGYGRGMQGPGGGPGYPGGGFSGTNAGVQGLPGGGVSAINRDPWSGGQFRGQNNPQFGGGNPWMRQPQDGISMGQGQRTQQMFQPTGGGTRMGIAGPPMAGNPPAGANYMPGPDGNTSPPAVNNGPGEPPGGQSAMEALRAEANTASANYMPGPDGNTDQSAEAARAAETGQAQANQPQDLTAQLNALNQQRGATAFASPPQFNPGGTTNDHTPPKGPDTSGPTDLSGWSNQWSPPSGGFQPSPQSAGPAGPMGGSQAPRYGAAPPMGALLTPPGSSNTALAPNGFADRPSFTEGGPQSYENGQWNFGAPGSGNQHNLNVYGSSQGIGPYASNFGNAPPGGWSSVSPEFRPGGIWYGRR